MIQVWWLHIYEESLSVGWNLTKLPGAFVRIETWIFEMDKGDNGLVYINVTLKNYFDLCITYNVFATLTCKGCGYNMSNFSFFFFLTSERSHREDEVFIGITRFTMDLWSGEERRGEGKANRKIEPSMLYVIGRWAAATQLEKIEARYRLRLYTWKENYY